MNISVFQALTLLLRKYEHNPSQRALIKPIYLRGITSALDNEQLNTLLNDELLSDYNVCHDLKSMTEDPVRRYFESILMLENLNDALDELDKKKLEQLFELHFNEMTVQDQTDMSNTVFINKNLHLVSGRNLGEEEYAHAIALLKHNEGFLIFRPKNMHEEAANLIFKERKEKLLFIVKCAFCAVVNVQARNNAYPINIYIQPDSVFSPENRGRIPKGSPGISNLKQIVKGHNLGIMKSYMPLAKDSPLYSAVPSTYVRPTDVCRYQEGKLWPSAIQQKQTLTFVNSISGTLLMELRISKKFMDHHAYPYADSKKQLNLFFKAYIGFLLYSAGGHCIEEFTSVFRLSEVQDAMSELDGFDTLHTEGLFSDTRHFNSALSHTMKYNQTLLTKNKAMEKMTYIASPC